MISGCDRGVLIGFSDVLRMISNVLRFPEDVLGVIVGILRMISDILRTF